MRKESLSMYRLLPAKSHLYHPIEYENKDGGILQETVFRGSQYIRTSPVPELTSMGKLVNEKATRVGNT